MTVRPKTNRSKMEKPVLFPQDLPVRQWCEFPAQGYQEPVSGAIFTSGQPPCCGMPLGGLGTGCLDLDPRGIFGFSSLFNPGSLHPVFKNWWMPRRLPEIEPFLGLSVAGRTWVLAVPEVASGGSIDWCTEPQMQEKEGKQTPTIQLTTPDLEEVELARRITYWGHYPVADLEFESQAPLQVGLRAWAPFVPGDMAVSNIPAAVFEVHLRNPGEQELSGVLAFSFPGPDAQEARAVEFTRQTIREDFSGVQVSSLGEVQYLLGVLDEPGARFGGRLNQAPDAWSHIAAQLPAPAGRPVMDALRYQEGGCSAAVDFNLPAGEQRVVRFLLAWYAPMLKGVHKTWQGEDVVVEGTLRNRWVGSPWEGDTHYFWHMYATRFSSALEVARYMAKEHGSILSRILAWQAAIYQDRALPVWLRDSLVNNLGLIAEDSYWFQPRAPLGTESFPLGAFALNESPRGCPHMSCIPCDWYGNLPIVFFFPELARSNLKLFKQYQREEGEIPFAIGKIAELPDMATPEYYWQVSLNGMCYIDMVDRLWQRTGDDAVLGEFYASVKLCNTYTMNLRPGPGCPISMPAVGGMEWFEYGDWAGMAAHMGGLRLAELRMVERMAEAVGDRDYAAQCRDWLAEGSRAMEEELWSGSYYLNYYEKETGKRSDDVMGYQLDGEWTARYHGLPGVFQAGRVSTTLDTIRRCNVALTPEIGAANFTRPDGSPLPQDSKVAAYGQYAMFCPELVLLGMTYIYAGEAEFGLELVRKHWQNLCLQQGHIWDLPNMVRGDNGVRTFGSDYYQNMMLWALPAALAGQDLSASCAPGSLIDRLLSAGKASG